MPLAWFERNPGVEVGVIVGVADRSGRRLFLRPGPVSAEGGEGDDHEDADRFHDSLHNWFFCGFIAGIFAVKNFE